MAPGPQMVEVTDWRIDDLITNLMPAGNGFANHVIWRKELASLLVEVKRARERPLHCPGCDGDHL